MNNFYTKKLIKGVVKYSDWEIVSNATIIIYICYLDDKNHHIKEEIGYTSTNENGKFSFCVNQYNLKNLEYIIEIFNPLNESNCKNK
ncbi:hypothetical protein [Paraclostridium sordellii]|uniref:hypothetical protein n=1 Tax=Paraclostridium sordellii TaxID=1505 RepID=UPI0022E6189A|nr:hypothetical protein [Paeniclostridium sordellii]